MTSEEIDLDYLRSWIGSRERATETITSELVKRYRATLGSHTELPASQIPLGIHWCLAPSASAQDELGIDGHPARGGFLPPVPLPRRMWASSKLSFYSQPKVDASIERSSMVADVVLKKSARSGPLVFVTVDHQYRQKISKSSETLLDERQTIVYKNHSEFHRPEPQITSTAPCVLSIVPDSKLLFRYSALTFNAHRIHYDNLYATVEEGYPGLVVHGPLMATLLMNLARSRRTQSELQNFEFRAAAPAFVDQGLQILVNDDDNESFEIRNHEQASIMKASANFADYDDS